MTRDEVTFDINGHVFKVEVNDEMVERIQKQRDKIDAIDFRNATEDDVEKEFYHLCKKMVNAVLGKGGYEKIFMGRKKNILENVDVIAYIFEEIENIKNPKNAAAGTTGNFENIYSMMATQRNAL
ncbi:hypothetical protein [Eubacterium aggregans]|uniref:hypothetical protein n=1 Tax=Eubacterium aggregans TaxID=81409 RepID=UPI003F2E663D